MTNEPARGRTPVPGRPVRGSQSGRPVMALLDLLGRRWSMRVLWETHENPGRTFRELMAACGDISSSVLGTRLRELTDAGVLERGSAGYQLTRHGDDLVAQLLGLERWANRWSRRQSFPHEH